MAHDSEEGGDTMQSVTPDHQARSKLATGQRPLRLASLIVAGGGVVLIIVGSIWYRGRSAALPDSEFPPAATDTASATIEFMSSNGQQLLEFHQAASEIGDELAEPECREMAERLDEEAPADVVLALAAGVPDPVLSDAFIRQRRVLGVALTTCVEVGSAPTDDLAVANRVVQSRMDELGVAS